VTKTLFNNVIGMMTSRFSKLTQRQREQLLIHQFQKWLVKVVPQNFLPLRIFSVLHAGKKDNLIYNAARCFGKQCHGDVGSRMPLDRMPFIAVKAHLAFFNSILYKCCYTTNSDKSLRNGGSYAPINVKPQRGGRTYVGHLIFEQIFNQMPHCWAINIGQIPHHFAINCNKYYINKSHFGSNCPNSGPKFLGWGCN
jgi:hypothetical protein